MYNGPTNIREKAHKIGTRGWIEITYNVTYSSTGLNTSQSISVAVSVMIMKLTQSHTNNPFGEYFKQINKLNMNRLAAMVAPNRLPDRATKTPPQKATPT